MDDLNKTKRGDGGFGGSNEIAATAGERKALGVVGADMSVQIAGSVVNSAARRASGLRVDEGGEAASGNTALE